MRRLRQKHERPLDRLRACSVRGGSSNGSCPRVRSSVYASYAGQALDEDLRRAGNEVSHGGETRNDVQISELAVYCTVAVGSGRLSI